MPGASTEVSGAAPGARLPAIRLEKQGKFPKHVNIVPGCNHWFEDEVDAHLKQLAAGRNQVAA